MPKTPSSVQLTTTQAVGGALALLGGVLAIVGYKQMKKRKAEANRLVLEEKRKFSVCVFCGSRTGNGDDFENAAKDLGKQMVAKDIPLVYGGGSIGLMGAIANTVNDAGGSVTGIIPYALAPKEISGNHLHIGEVIHVPTMHIRKQLMAEKSDAFIALPGGLGTMEELCEMFTWSQLGIHRKAIGLLNINGFYDPYIKSVENMIEHGFTDAKWLDVLVVADNAEELLEKLKAHQPPVSEINWISEKSS